MSRPSTPPDSLRKAAWIFLAAFALLGFSRDWAMVTRTGSIDFRNRVTGARLLVAGEDAYHYKWLPGAPEGWCDVYANRAHPVTKTTVTPAMLLLTGPVAALPYPLAQRFWLLLQWACLTGIWWLWFQPLTSSGTRLLWTFLIVAFSWTLAWRHHVDRGQYYILLTLILSCWITRSRSATASHALLTGAMAGLLAALRPPLLLLVAPFIWWRRPAQRQGLALGCAVAILLPWLGNGDSWGQYGRAMGEWSRIYRHDENPAPGPLAYPPVIEGLGLDHLSRYAVRQYADSSLFRLARALGLPAVPAPLVLAILLLLLGLWWRAAGSRGDAVVLTGIAGWSFLIDFFLPAYRNPYNDTLIPGTLACLLAFAPASRIPLILTACGLGTGWILSVWEPPALWLIHLPTLFFIALACRAVVPTAAPPHTQ